MDNTEQAPSLLEQKRALEEATKTRIADLLQMRDQLEVDTVAHLDAIAAELKELGYKRPRAKPQPKAETPKKTKKSVDKSTTTA